MTLHARCSIGRKLVTPVAVRTGAAQLRPPVLDLHLLVALVTLQNGFCSWFVRVVTRFAGQRCVDREPRIALRLKGPVASRAVPPSKDAGLRLEDVARVAIHWLSLEIDVRERRLFLVALRADPCVDSVKGELGRVVTFVAFHVSIDHVCGVPR